MTLAHFRKLALVLCAVGLLGTPAQGQPASEMYSPKDGKFTIKFPGKPAGKSQTVKTDLGSLKAHTAVYADANGNANWVTYIDYPADAIKPAMQASLYEAQRDGLKGADGKVVSEKDIVQGTAKRAGREVVLDRGKQQIRVRFVVRDSRLFQVGVMGTGEFITGKEATAFLDSFEAK